MDSRGFDALTRELASGATRRNALRTLGGGTLAAALTWLHLGGGAHAQNAADSRCRGAGERCRRDQQCCAERCIDRFCTCRGPGGQCFIDRGCCSGRCKKRTGRCA